MLDSNNPATITKTILIAIMWPFCCFSHAGMQWYLSLLLHRARLRLVQQVQGKNRCMTVANTDCCHGPETVFIIGDNSLMWQQATVNTKLSCDHFSKEFSLPIYNSIKLSLNISHVCARVTYGPGQNQVVWVHFNLWNLLAARESWCTLTFNS